MEGEVNEEGRLVLAIRREKRDETESEVVGSMSSFDLKRAELTP